MPAVDAHALDLLFEQVCRDGYFGDDGYSVALQMAEQLVRRHPAAGRAIDEENPAHGLVAELYADVRMSHRLRQICERSDSGTEFGRLLYTLLKGLLIDHFRKTDRGALHRRIRGLLKNLPGVEQIPSGQPYGGCWQHTGTMSEWDGDEERLRRDADQYAFEPVDWESDKRRSPRISDEDLADLINVILRSAGGAISVSVLGRVCSDRVGIGVSPTFVDLFDTDGTVDLMDDRTQSDVQAAANDILESLSDTEREEAARCSVGVGRKHVSYKYAPIDDPIRICASDAPAVQPRARYAFVPVAKQIREALTGSYLVARGTANDILRRDVDCVYRCQGL